MQLFTHQQNALDAAAPALTKPGSRATISMACGTGKTLTGIRIAEHVMAETANAKIIVFAPTLALLDQLMTNWVALRAFGGKFTMLPVASSGSSIALTNKSDTVILAHTTDAKEISNALQTKGRLVVFSTYQSANSVKRALPEDKSFSFDFAIMDEAHRTAGGGKDPDSSYIACLHDSLIPIKRRLFTTATPKACTSASYPAGGVDILKHDFRDYGHSMNDTKVYGDVVFTYSFAEAISEGMLADYRIAVVMVSNDDILKAAMMDSRIDLTGVNLNNPSKKDEKKVASAKDLAVTAVLARMFQNGMVKGALSFHQDRENSTIFSDNASTFLSQSNDPRLADAYLAHVDGETPQFERHRMMREFQLAHSASRFAMISNCAVFTEGVDVPELDTVVFADNKTSKISIVQAVGRAVRLDKKNPNKIANVIVPVFIGGTENPIEKINTTKFKTLYSTISALRENDNMAALYSKAFRDRALEEESITTETVSEMMNVLDADGNVVAGQEGAAISVMASESEGNAADMSKSVVSTYRKFLSACEAKIIEESGSVFERNLGKLEAYKNKNKGKCDVIGKDATVGHFAIGKAMGVVHDQFVAGTLPKDEQEAYERVGFVFRKPSSLFARLLEVASAQ